MPFGRVVWFPPALIAAALLSLGAQGPVARPAVCTAAALAFLVLAANRFANRAAAGMADLLGGRPFLLAALPVLGAVQVVLHATVRLSDGPLAAMVQETARLASLVAFFAVVRHAARGRSDFVFLLAGLVVIGGVEACYGLLNLLAGNERLLFYKRTAYLNSATGTLVNRNHFAYLMEMTIPATFVAMGWAQEAPGTRQVPESERKARALLLGTVCVLELLALLFSRSRMGIVCFPLACATVAILDRTFGPQRQAARRSRAAGVLLVAVALAVAFAIGIDPVVERFARLERDLGEGGRREVWAAAARMAASKPLLGHGFGTFATLVPGYRLMPSGVRFDHAHNDYLEIAAEAGIAGLAAIAALIAVFLRRLFSTLASCHRTRERRVVLWLAAAIIAVLLHSLADFGLRITAVAFTFVYVAALFARACELADAAATAGRTVTFPNTQ